MSAFRCDACGHIYGMEETHQCPSPSPASPAVGAEEEAKKYAHQKCEEFLAAHGSLPYGFHGFAKAIYLAGFSRGGEVEREKSEDAMRAAIGAKDAAVECAAALKQERDELREGMRTIASFCPEGHVSIVPQKALQQATKICRALLASRAEPPSGERGSGG